MIAFFLLLATMVPNDPLAAKPPQDIVLVVWNLLPLSVVACVVSSSALHAGLQALNKAMSGLVIIFLGGTAVMYLTLAELFQNDIDRMYAWAMLVPGCVLLLTHWAFTARRALRLEGQGK
ncbi:hypothetical protein [Rhizobium oryzicola]|uniref:Transmembrane protein n=1 Tax=Rhizobium oryzicola TaxID=1232668 RepID=A0ABT8T0I0_9HYPH|nr:hypothetical protein [Rhizobium oryzicola]MDO1583909.1 hypothetical protein [Rhizobium oryzicola]